MNKLNTRSYPTTLRTIRPGLRRRPAKPLHVRKFPAPVETVETASMPRMMVAILEAVLTAVGFTLVLAATAAYFID